MAVSTLFLSRAEVVKSLDPRALVPLLGEAFQAHSERTKRSEGGSSYPLSAGHLATSAPGVVEGIPLISLKLECLYPGKNPSTSGYLHLCDPVSGRLVALLESSHISSLGSALTGALATDLLSVPDSRTVAMIGNGNQAWLGLRFLMEMRALEEVYLFDLNRRKSCRMAERLQRYDSLKVRVCDSLGEAVSSADIICTATWSTRPFLFSEMVKPGAHISTFGSDSADKSELAPELLRGCSFFCDDRDLALSVGALRGVRDGSSLIVGELGEILSGRVAGRTDAEEITVYGAVGLPMVDLVAGWLVFNKARKKGLGRQLEV